MAGSSQTIKSALDALNSKITLNLTVATTDTNDTSVNIKAVADGIYTEIGNNNTSFAGNVFVTGHDAYTVTGSIRNNVTKFFCIRTSGNMFKVVRASNGTVTYKEVANKDDVYSLTAVNTITSNDDLNNYTTPGTFYAQSSTIANSLLHCPTTGYGFKLIVEHLAWTGTLLQTIKTAHVPPKYFTRRGQVSSNVWSFGEWVEDPSREEITALNSNFDGVKFYYKTATSSGNTFTLGNGFRGLLFTIDSSNDRCGAYFLYSSGTGVVATVAIKEATALTMDKSVAGKLTITSPGATKVLFITAANIT